LEKTLADGDVDAGTLFTSWSASVMPWELEHTGLYKPTALSFGEFELVSPGEHVTLVADCHSGEVQ
jgi:hypothetical protein